MPEDLVRELPKEEGSPQPRGRAPLGGPPGPFTEGEWSYSGNPKTSVKDAVRWEIQDTNVESQLLQDPEILYAISLEAPNVPPSQGEVLSASARCMEALERLFAAQADTDLGSLKLVYTKQAEGYKRRALELRMRASGMHSPWTGGTSISEKQAREDVQGVVNPLFRRGQFNIPYRGPSTVPFPPGRVQEEEV